MNEFKEQPLKDKDVYKIFIKIFGIRIKTFLLVMWLLFFPIFALCCLINQISFSIGYAFYSSCMTSYVLYKGIE